MFMKKAFSLIAALCGTLLSNAQSISVPFELTTMTIDGQINASEWQNADSVKLPVAGNDTVTIFYKHDMTNLYVAFAGPLESHSGNIIYPEVLIDPQQLGGSSWQSGQWWFHISTSVCESNGTYGVFTNCQSSQTGWEAAPNIIPGPPDTDSVEMRISFSKIGFNAVTQYNMGLAFVLTDKTSLYYTWPLTADKDVPSTWSDARLIKFPVDAKNVATSTAIRIYPNPSADKLNITGVDKACNAKLIDAMGSVVKVMHLSAGNNTIDVSNVPNGVYQLQMIGADAITTTSVSIVR